jgi:hypothetical protein
MKMFLTYSVKIKLTVGKGTSILVKCSRKTGLVKPSIF